MASRLHKYCNGAERGVNKNYFAIILILFYYGYSKEKKKKKMRLLLWARQSSYSWSVLLSGLIMMIINNNGTARLFFAVVITNNRNEMGDDRFVVQTKVPKFVRFITTYHHHRQITLDWYDTLICWCCCYHMKGSLACARSVSEERGAHVKQES